MSEADKQFPYIPKNFTFSEQTSHSMIYNDNNIRIERIINEYRELVKDNTIMKNIILGELQKWGETNDENNLSVHTRIEEVIKILNMMNRRLDEIESKQSNMQNVLAEIKDRVTEYEVDQEFDDTL
jgi:uncharacterized protein (UPF0147 family)